MPIRYRPNYQKILEAIVYIASKRPACDFHSMLKTLFYADKYHLQSYGRPVLGDSYIKMSFGPVGSIAYDMLKVSDFLPPEIAKKVEESLSVRLRKTPVVNAKRNADIGLFSESDIICLDKALVFCQEKTFNDLCDISHQEKAWVQSSMNQEVDYELIIDDDIENRDELLVHARETSATIAL